MFENLRGCRWYLVFYFGVYDKLYGVIIKILVFCGKIIWYMGIIWFVLVLLLEINISNVI